MRYRISAGALVLRQDRLLLLRHYVPGRYDFWAPPGGGVEEQETLETAAEREAFEETGLKIVARRLAYIDELFSPGDRRVKFWFLADPVGGEIDLDANPAPGESIVAAHWWERGTPLPGPMVFPAPLQTSFWDDLAGGFAAPIRIAPQRQQV